MVCADSFRFSSSALAVALLALSFSAQAAHPLLTDDAGTQGAGRWQFELNTDHTRTREGGVGDTTLQAKWRFFKNAGGWSLGLRPAVILPTGSASKGLGNGRVSASVALISTLERGDWTWLANAGYAWNNNRVGDRRQLWAVSSAVLYAASPQWSLALDMGISRSADTGASHDKYGLIGAIYHAGEDVDLDVGWRRSLGGGPVVHTLGAGVTVRW